LKHFAAAHIDKGLSSLQAEVVFALAQERQDEVRAQAQIAGQALNAAKPEDLGRETEIYWTSASGLKLNALPQSARKLVKVAGPENAPSDEQKTAILQVKP
jgi:hypothetical protein